MFKIYAKSVHSLHSCANSFDSLEISKTLDFIGSATHVSYFVRSCQNERDPTNLVFHARSKSVSIAITATCGVSLYRLCNLISNTCASSKSFTALERRTKPVNESSADNSASQGKQSEVGLKRSFEADAQLSEAGEPCMRALDHPSMLTEAVILLDASASDPGNDAAPTQVLPTTRETEPCMDERRRARGLQCHPGGCLPIKAAPPNAHQASFARQCGGSNTLDRRTRPSVMPRSQSHARACPRIAFVLS